MFGFHPYLPPGDINPRPVPIVRQKIIIPTGRYVTNIKKMHIHLIDMKRFILKNVSILSHYFSLNGDQSFHDSSSTLT